MLVTSFSQADPKRTTEDRKLMVKGPRTNGGPGSLSCWKGRSTAKPFLTGHWGLVAPDRSNLIKALNVPSYAHCECGLGDAA
jgi:hypothetical protein